MIIELNDLQTRSEAHVFVACSWGRDGDCRRWWDIPLTVSKIPSGNNLSRSGLLALHGFENSVRIRVSLARQTLCQRSDAAGTKVCRLA